MKLPKVLGPSEFETRSIGSAERAALRENCFTETQFESEQGQPKNRGTGYPSSTASAEFSEAKVKDVPTQSTENTL